MGVRNLPCASGKSSGSVWSVGVLDFPATCPWSVGVLDLPSHLRDWWVSPISHALPGSQPEVCGRWVSSIFSSLDFPLDFPDFPVIGGCPQFSISRTRTAGRHSTSPRIHPRKPPKTSASPAASVVRISPDQRPLLSPRSPVHPTPSGSPKRAPSFDPTVSGACERSIKARIAGEVIQRQGPKRDSKSPRSAGPMSPSPSRSP